MSEPQPSAFERRNSEDFKTLRGYLLCGFGAPLDSRVRVEGLRVWDSADLEILLARGAVILSRLY